MPDVFDTLDEVKGNWWKYDNVGDTIKGTYISKRRQMNQLRGEEQWVYEILTQEGEVWNVGGKPGIDNQMSHIKPGQYIKMTLIEIRKPSKAGLNPAKIVQVYANPKAINQEWIEQQMSEVPSGQETPVGVIPELEEVGEPQEIDEDDDELPFYDTPQEKKDVIVKLANKKLKIDDPKNIERIVMEATSLAFIDSNLDKIIEKLKLL